MPPNWSNNVWSVTTSKSAIADTSTVEKLESEIQIPMPEMVFNQNSVELVHIPTSSVISFNAIDALDAVDKDYNGETKILQVAHTDVWKASKIKNKQRADPSTTSQFDYDVTKIHNPYDWTYTTKYKGTFSPAFKQEILNSDEIPYSQLKKRVPIEFYDDVSLYEDELGDFGLCTYNVKVRCMHDSLFLLARMYMRVDNVAFRIRDLRLFIDFNTPNQVITKYTEKETDFSVVKTRVPLGMSEDYTRLFRDPNWIEQNLDDVKSVNYKYYI